MNTLQYKEYLNSYNKYQSTFEDKSLKDLSNIDLKKNFERYMKSVGNANVINFKRKNDIEKYTKITQRNIRSDMFIYKKIRKHPDHTNLMVKTCSYRSYYMFKIADQIWKNEKIDKEDLRMLPNIYWIFLYQMVSCKFKVEVDISNIDTLFFQLSNLRLNFDKRKEEILKFVLKRFLKKIFLKEIFKKNDNNFISILHNEFFKEKIELRYFKNIFIDKDQNDKRPYLKGFNHFAKLIIKNTSLKKEFLLFLDKLPNEYKKEITKKFFHIFKIVKKKFKNKSKFMENFQKTVKLVDNKRFCSPWTLEEVKKSTAFIRQNFFS